MLIYSVLFILSGDFLMLSQIKLDFLHSKTSQDLMLHGSHLEVNWSRPAERAVQKIRYETGSSSNLAQINNL